MPTPDEESEQILRQQLLDAAPKPSEAHDSAILEAAHRSTATQAAPSRPGWLYAGAALAATVIIGIALAPQLDPIEPAVTRSDNVGLASPAADREFGLPLQAFRWQPVVGVSEYRVRVYDDKAIEIAIGEWQSETVSDADFVEGILVPGQRYFWTVELRDSDSAETLGPFWFRTESR